MKLEDIDAALKIDKHALDENWERQHQLNTTIGDMHEEAVRKRDIKKQQIEVAHADLDAQFRKDAVGDGGKITETSLKHKITLSPRMRKLEEELIDLAFEVGRLSARRESCRQRNDGLKGLTALHGQNYFVSDGAGRETREAKNKQAEGIRAQTGQRFRRERE